MVYIYALILIPSAISSIPGRIVFSHTPSINYVQTMFHNDIYKLSHFEFPKPEDSSGIVMAMDDSRTPGNHHAIYSAVDMPYADMMTIIMGAASPLTEEEIISLDKDVDAVQECHRYLQNSALEYGTVMPLKLSNVVESRKCTVRSIASLAFEDQVEVGGKYSYFAPGSVSSSIKINADYAVAVEDLVLPQQSTIHKDYRLTRAIVWYQGRPHLLAQCGKNKPAWFLQTTIKGKMEGRSLDSAISLVNFIYGKRRRLVRKSDVGMKLDIKRMSKINPVKDHSYHGTSFLINVPKTGEDIPGVLVDQDDCNLYKSSSRGIFHRGVPS